MYIDGWWIYFAHDYVRGMLRALFVGINHKWYIHTSEQLSVHSPGKKRDLLAMSCKGIRF
jgi:hypothetical protein